MKTEPGYISNATRWLLTKWQEESLFRDIYPDIEFRLFSLNQYKQLD